MKTIIHCLFTGSVILERDVVSWHFSHSVTCHLLRAEITLARVTSDLLMLVPSFSLVPIVHVALALSLPSRSTRWILFCVSRGNSTSMACKNNTEQTSLSSKRQCHRGILRHVGGIMTEVQLQMEKPLKTLEMSITQNR